MQQIVRVPQDGVPVVQARDAARDPQMGKNFSIKTDVVVVGSGAGGSIVAYQMAKAGRSVLVLESGRYYPSSTFTEHLGDTLTEAYRDQGSQINTTADVLFPEGACVGGGTVVGAAVMQKPQDRILKSWADDFGLEALHHRQFDKYYARVGTWLQNHVNEAHEINATSHKVIQGCEKMGFSWKPVIRNVKRCALTGHCLAGCPSDRKISALVSHLPWASAYGARIFSDTHVSRVLMRAGRATGVEAVIRDPETGTIVSNLRVDADVVVAAAGAIQTPLLLQRSQVPDRSGQIGENLSVQPFVQLLGRFDDPLYGFRGALVGVQVDEFVNSDGYNFWSGLAEPEQLMIQGEQQAGKEHIDFMKSYKYMAGLNAFIADEGKGSVKWDGGLHDGRKEIKWNPSREEFRHITRATALASRILFSAGANRVWLPTFEALHAENVFELDQQLSNVDYGINGLYSYRLNSFSSHGSCRMGVDPYESVVSENGEMHDVTGLYLADASIIPTAMPVPPQWTTQALASLVADRIEARAKNHFLT